MMMHWSYSFGINLSHSLIFPSSVLIKADQLNSLLCLISVCFATANITVLDPFVCLFSHIYIHACTCFNVISSSIGIVCTQVLLPTT
jgi:hypothetical protein